MSTEHCCCKAHKAGKVTCIAESHVMHIPHVPKGSAVHNDLFWLENEVHHYLINLARLLARD